MYSSFSDPLLQGPLSNVLSPKIFLNEIRESEAKKVNYKIGEEDMKIIKIQIKCFYLK